MLQPGLLLHSPNLAIIAYRLPFLKVKYRNNVQVVADTLYSHKNCRNLM